MKHYRAADRPTVAPPEANFTGTVLAEPIIQTPEPASLRALKVSFAPGARTAWHTHPVGQTLYVLSGIGRFQTEGEAIVELRAGDTVWIPPGEKHWHGGSPNNAMVHIAMQEEPGDQATDWLEKVTDAEYTG